MNNNELAQHHPTHIHVCVDWANEKWMTPTLVNGICSEVEHMMKKMPTNYEYFHATLDLDWKYNDDDVDEEDDNTGFRHVKQDVGIHVVQ